MRESIRNERMYRCIIRKLIKNTFISSISKKWLVTKEEQYEFTFDRIFPNTIRQIEVFEFATKPLIGAVFDGLIVLYLLWTNFKR